MPVYPFASKNRQDFKKLREGQDYVVWIKPGMAIERLVSKVDAPIVEIGGPTSSGYYFLDQLPLLTKPIITNITPTPVAMFSENAASYIDKVVDGRNLPYKNESVGMFLMSGMSITSDWYMELADSERDNANHQILLEYDVARLEIEQVALGLFNPIQVKYAQRVAIYREVYRALKPAGLFMTDGNLEEIASLQHMGFEIIAFTQEVIRQEQGWEGIYYEAVFQKNLV